MSFTSHSIRVLLQSLLIEDSNPQFCCVCPRSWQAYSHDCSYTVPNFPLKKSTTMLLSIIQQQNEINRYPKNKNPHASHTPTSQSLLSHNIYTYPHNNTFHTPSSHILPPDINHNLDTKAHLVPSFFPSSPFFTVRHFVIQNSLSILTFMGKVYW